VTDNLRKEVSIGCSKVVGFRNEVGGPWRVEGIGVVIALG
jgi:hypothetical protein